jgi:hypothetical protein
MTVARRFVAVPAAGGAGAGRADGVVRRRRPLPLLWLARAARACHQSLRTARRRDPKACQLQGFQVLLSQPDLR